MYKPFHASLDPLVHADLRSISQHALCLVPVESAIDGDEADAIAGHVRLRCARGPNPHEPLTEPADDEADPDGDDDNVLRLHRPPRRGGNLARELPEQHGLVVGDVEALAMDAAVRRGRGLAVGGDEGAGRQHVCFDQIVDVDEVEDVLAVAHLEAGLTLLGDGDHLAEAGVVVLAEGGGGSHGDGQHGGVAGSAVSGEDVGLGGGLGQGVAALLDGRAEDGQEGRPSDQ